MTTPARTPDDAEAPGVDPAEICTLPPDGLEARLAWIGREILPHAVATHRGRREVAIELADAPGLRARLDRLVALERACCGGVAFAVTPVGARDRLRLEIRGVDPDAPVFAGLARPGASARPEADGGPGGPHVAGAADALAGADAPGVRDASGVPDGSDAPAPSTPLTRHIPHISHTSLTPLTPHTPHTRRARYARRGRRLAGALGAGTAAGFLVCCVLPLAAVALVGSAAAPLLRLDAPAPILATAALTAAALWRWSGRRRVGKRR